MIPQLLTPPHIAVVLGVLLLIFGPKRLPETGRALGRGLREFREAIADRDAPRRSTGADLAPSTETRRHLDRS